MVCTEVDNPNTSRATTATRIWGTQARYFPQCSELTNLSHQVLLRIILIPPEINPVYSEIVCISPLSQVSSGWRKWPSCLFHRLLVPLSERQQRSALPCRLASLDPFFERKLLKEEKLPCLSSSFLLLLSNCVFLCLLSWLSKASGTQNIKEQNKTESH